MLAKDCGELFECSLKSLRNSASLRKRERTTGGPLNIVKASSIPAGHNVDELSLFQAPSQTWSAETSNSPDALANDLSNLFEVAGGYQPIAHSKVGDSQGHDGLFSASGNGIDGFEIGSEEMSNILKELF